MHIFKALSQEMELIFEKLFLRASSLLENPKNSSFVKLAASRVLDYKEGIVCFVLCICYNFIQLKDQAEKSSTNISSQNVLC